MTTGIIRHLVSLFFADGKDAIVFVGSKEIFFVSLTDSKNFFDEMKNKLKAQKRFGLNHFAFHQAFDITKQGQLQDGVTCQSFTDF